MRDVDPELPRSNRLFARTRRAPHHVPLYPPGTFRSAVVTEPCSPASGWSPGPGTQNVAALAPVKMRRPNAAAATIAPFIQKRFPIATRNLFTGAPPGKWHCCHVFRSLIPHCNGFDLGYQLGY